jgi:hypothetical protein
VLKAPEADLLDRHGKFVGNHFLGPTWQWRDGSKVKGAAAAKVASPDPASNVPWLLLNVTTQAGDGELSDVRHIQRLHTTGGVAPAGACTTEGEELRVPYTADYLFYHLADCAPPHNKPASPPPSGPPPRRRARWISAHSRLAPRALPPCPHPRPLESLLNQDPPHRAPTSGYQLPGGLLGDSVLIAH